MLVVALAIKLSSRGPILYRQTRVGWQGRHFTLYKFRSMNQDAEAATGAIWAAKDDARVTPIGHWLRKTAFGRDPAVLQRAARRNVAGGAAARAA